MRGRAALSNRRSENNPNAILLDHFDSIDSVNEITNQLTYFNPKATIVQGQFGNGLNLSAPSSTNEGMGLVKSYDVSGLDFKLDSDFIIDLFMAPSYIRDANNRFALYLKTSTMTDFITFDLSVWDRLTQPIISYYLSYKTGQCRADPVKYNNGQYNHFVLISKNLYRTRLICLYLNGELVGASFLDINYSNYYKVNSIEIQHTLGNIKMDELYITKDTWDYEFPVPNVPYKV